MRSMHSEPQNTTMKHVLLAKELTFTFAICHRPSVCRLSVCNVRAPSQAIEIFGNVSSHLIHLVISDLSVQIFTEIVPGELLRWGLTTRGVAKYSDFGPFDGYISETMQDMI